MKHLALRFLFSCVGIAAGIYFRDFWRSDLGPPTFIFVVFLSTTLVMSWQGKGRPWSPISGLIFGLAITIAMIITFFINHYAGMATLVLFAALAHKTGLWQRWADKL
ncbi:hypothetical protein JQK88_24685 [Mesorhizobium caraganae]|uniref:hypothetical protein n=1 Tax=Mesorhizobium caraganae TaxID=483206 RepID=UPI00177AEAE3|nr:hypothetical protein [Mesorhizobium caraganae]MBM2714356.1 hypothetical protein [Mesorhizobium caraganae]